MANLTTTSFQSNACIHLLPIFIYFFSCFFLSKHVTFFVFYFFCDPFFASRRCRPSWWITPMASMNWNLTSRSSTRKLPWSRLSPRRSGRLWLRSFPISCSNLDLEYVCLEIFWIMFRNTCQIFQWELICFYQIFICRFLLHAMSVQAFLLTDSQITDERFLVFINVTELQKKQLGDGKCQLHFSTQPSQSAIQSIDLSPWASREFELSTSFEHFHSASLRIFCPVATFLISLPERQERCASRNSLISWFGWWNVELFEIHADLEILWQEYDNIFSAIRNAAKFANYADDRESLGLEVSSVAGA